MLTRLQRKIYQVIWIWYWSTEVRSNGGIYLSGTYRQAIPMDIHTRVCVLSGCMRSLQCDKGIDVNTLTNSLSQKKKNGAKLTSREITVTPSPSKKKGREMHSTLFKHSATLGTRYGASRDRGYAEGCQFHSFAIDMVSKSFLSTISSRFGDVLTLTIYLQIFCEFKSHFFFRGRRPIFSTGNVDGVAWLVLVRSVIAYLRLWASFF